ncbi:hypothetical protein AA313_de0209891 [Arthrobotrys entomopaga]|nr:hypothetical protein AA313_de0209891 [Arthrobotrys entomopaga]
MTRQAAAREAVLGRMVVSPEVPIDLRSLPKLTYIFQTELGAALGAFFESVFEEFASMPMSNTDWVNMVIDQTSSNPDVKAKNLNVMVFRENLLKSQFFFLNASMWKTSRDGILGWMNGDYYVVVFEAAWFIAYGSPDDRGSSEWNYSVPNDDCVAVGGGGQTVALTYPTYDYSLHNYWDPSKSKINIPHIYGEKLELTVNNQVLQYDADSNHDFYGIQGMVVKWSTADYWNTTAIRSQWGSNGWQQDKTEDWNLDPTYA